MGKYIIQSHQRLQEWVAEENGYFAAEGLDYEFQVKGLAQDSKQTSMVQSADALAKWGIRARAFEDMSHWPRVRRVLGLSTWAVNGVAAAGAGKMMGPCVHRDVRSWHLRRAALGLPHLRRTW